MNTSSSIWPEDEDELHLALVEGLVSREQLEPLRAEVIRLGRSPLELLLERGQLSAETLLSLRGDTRRQAQTGSEGHEELECGVLAHGLARVRVRVVRTDFSSPSRARDEGCAPPATRSGRM